MRAIAARKLILRVGAACTALMLAALTGCAPSEHADTHASEAAKLAPLAELTPVADPSAYEGPTTVVVPKTEFKPLADKPQQQLPVTVTSRPHTGEREVTVKDTSRIVSLSLSGAVSDFIYAYGFGDNIVGADVSTSVPGREIPVVTRNGHSVDAESVLELNPSVVLTDGSIGPMDVIEQFADAGVPVVFVRGASTYEESFEQGQQVADALGVSELGEKLRTEFTAKIAAKEAEIKRLIPADKSLLPRVAFLYMRGEGVFYLFGEGTGIDQLLSSLGAVDVAKEINWVGHRPMNDEALVKANPDTILVMTAGLESVGGVDGMLEVHPAVALTDAGKKRRIVDAPDTGIFTGVTRIPETLDALARALYAPDSLPQSK